jgi:hypothetical protein
MLLSPASAANPTAKEMAERAKESLARDRTYEMKSVEAFWGDASFMQQCVPSDGATPASFVIYFEVLPDGTLGSTVFDPLTPEARCIKGHTAHRTFPRPPGAYVTRIEMSFKP